MMNLVKMMILAMSVAAAIEHESERFLLEGERDLQSLSSLEKELRRARRRLIWFFIVIPILVVIILIAACCACCGCPILKACKKEEQAPVVQMTQPGQPAMMVPAGGA